MPNEQKTITATVVVENGQARRAMRQTQQAGVAMGTRLEGVGRRVKAAWRDMGFGRVSGQVRGLMTSLGGLMGVYGLSQGIRKVREFEEALGDMAIQGGKSNAWLDGARKKILDTSSKWGIMKDQTMGFAQGLVQLTGNVDEAMGLMDKMALVSKATGASMQSLAGVVFQLGGALKVSKGDMTQAMAILRGGEKVGSVTFSSIAQYGGRVFPLLSQFGKAGTGLAGVRAAGGLMQIGARGFAASEPGQAATATATFLKQLFLKKGDVAKKLGVQVEGRELPEVFKDIGKAMQDSKKAAEALKIFAEGGRVAMELRSAYEQGWGTSVGAKTAASTIFGVKGDPASLAKEAAQRMEQPAQKWKKVMADLDAAMHKTLLPVMKDLVKIMPDAAKALKWFMGNAKDLFSAFIAFKATGALHGLISAFRGGGAGAVGIPGAVVAGGPAAAGARTKRGGMQVATLAVGNMLLAAGAVQALGSLLGALIPKKHQKSFEDRIEEAYEQKYGQFSTERGGVMAGMEDIIRENELAGDRAKRIRRGGIMDFREMGIFLRGGTQDIIGGAEDLAAGTLSRLKSRRESIITGAGKKGLSEKQIVTLERLEKAIMQLEKNLSKGVKLDASHIDFGKMLFGAQGRSDIRSGKGTA